MEGKPHYIIVSIVEIDYSEGSNIHVNTTMSIHESNIL
jgi:hypothetical protein